MADSPQNSGSDQARSPWLFVTIAGIILLAIVLFLVLRPVGNGGNSGTSPTSTKVK